MDRSARTDRVLPETKWIAAVVVLVLLTASLLLYLWPNNTQQYFAWTIKPSMTPLFMGSAYFAGVYFFARVVTTPRWHWVAADFPAIGVFTAFLGLTTLLHWDRFNHDHVSFYAWLILYVTTPFLVPALWLRNRRTDPGTLDHQDAIVPTPYARSLPRPARWCSACALPPSSGPISSSTYGPGRSVRSRHACSSGFFSWFGAVGLSLASKPALERVARHRAEPTGGAGVHRSSGPFAPGATSTNPIPLTWGWVGFILIILVGLASLYLVMETRRRAAVLSAVPAGS